MRETAVRSGLVAGGALVAILFSSVASAAAQSEAAVSLSIDGNPVQLQAADPQAVSRALPWVTGNSRSLPGSGSNAAADLATGTLRFEAVGATELVPSASAPEAQFPKAGAIFRDRITVAGPGTTVTMTATMDVDGALLVTGKAINDSGRILIGALAQIGLGAGLVTMSAARDVHVALPQTPLVDTTYVNPTALPSFGSVMGSSIQLHLEKAVSIPIGQPVDVLAQLATLAGVMDPGYAGQVTFGNTARFALSLPAGYTYTSVSGLLLSQAGGPGLPLVADGGAGVGGDGGAPVPPAPGQDGGAPGQGGGGGQGTGDGSGVGGQDASSGQSNGGSSGGCGTAGIGIGTASVLGPSAILFGLALVVSRRRRRQRSRSRRSCQAITVPPAQTPEEKTTAS